MILQVTTLLCLYFINYLTQYVKYCRISAENKKGDIKMDIIELFRIESYDKLNDLIKTDVGRAKVVFQLDSFIKCKIVYERAKGEIVNLAVVCAKDHVSNLKEYIWVYNRLGHYEQDLYLPESKKFIVDLKSSVYSYNCTKGKLKSFSYLIAEKCINSLEDAVYAYNNSMDALKEKGYSLALSCMNTMADCKYVHENSTGELWQQSVLVADSMAIKSDDRMWVYENSEKENKRRACTLLSRSLWM